MKKLFMEVQLFAKFNPVSHQRGYVVLISMLIVSVVGLAIASSMMAISISGSQSSLERDQATSARYLADACAEYAISQLLDANTYAGNEVRTLGDGTCTIRPVLGTGNTNRTVETFGTVDTTIRKIRVEIASLTPNVALTSWRDVADF
ncbi:MAG: hypothetical protein HZC01_04525 [Candidatus Kerfeldbacteria bacterium]|nr:hypothetical protein [Candidatus Kerfeldbacteria bacterium]